MYTIFISTTYCFKFWVITFHEISSVENVIVLLTKSVRYHFHCWQIKLYMRLVSNFSVLKYISWAVKRNKFYEKISFKIHNFFIQFRNNYCVFNKFFKGKISREFISAIITVKCFQAKLYVHPFSNKWV